MNFETTNPAIGQKIESHQRLNLADAKAEVDAAWKAFEAWSSQPISDRADGLRRWARALRDQKEKLAAQMTAEMGKPISQSRSEIDKSIDALEFLAKEGPAWLAPESVAMPKGRAEVSFLPRGPVLAIMPWNFPLWQTVRFAGPALLAGNTILLKHSDLTAGSAKIIAQTASAVGDMPLVRNLPIDHETTAELIAHPQVRGVTFTGSTGAGRQIAETAARHLKKTVLELGGSDAYVVLRDADIAQAAKICAESRMVNGGQSCVAAKRFIVERPGLPAFLQEFMKTMGAYRPGDPSKDDCKLGPLAAKKFQEGLHDQVNEMKKLGAEVLLGGEKPQGPGAFYPPTVLYFDKPHPKIGQIELFGPVATVIAAESCREAIRIANDSVFGLGAAIFTADATRGRALANELEAGIVAVNDFVRSDVRLPFGGVKESGWGRELSRHGLHEFCNLQTRTWPE